MGTFIIEPGIAKKCRDPGQAARLWQRILAIAAKAQNKGAAAFDDVLRSELATLPTPDRALLHLDRFLEASFSASGIIREFIAAPRQLRMFFRIVSYSEYLADSLVRDSQLFRWLSTSGVLKKKKSRDEYLLDAREAFGMFESEARRLDALKRFQRRELMILGAADILKVISVQDVTRALSWLADSILEVLLEYAVHKLASSNPQVAVTPIAIVSLGKLGGEELNYSSDIDLMVVYDDDGKNDPILHDGIIKVVNLLIQFLTTQSHQGFFYRTDLRLRPDGRAGALALSLSAMLLYYETRGALWERQMLQRARVSAGSVQLGTALFDNLEPFLYPKALAESPSRILGEVEKRLQVRSHQDNNVKYFEGGIRYIEFAVQGLQLIYGGDYPALRVPSTMNVCIRLEQFGLLKYHEANVLKRAYLFFRELEHALQLEKFEQTHTLPESDRELNELAWKLSFNGKAQFLQHIEQTRHAVLGVYKAIMQVESKPASQSALAETPVNFQVFESDSAQKVLRGLFYGRATAPFSASMQERMMSMRNELLTAIAAEALPYATLVNLERLMQSSKNREGIIGYLSEEKSRDLLLRLSCMAPQLLLSSASEPIILEGVFSGWSHEPQTELSPRTYRFMQEIRFIGDHLLGNTSIEVLSESLSDVADSIIDRVFSAKFNHIDAPAILIAGGSYGGRELLYGSDLDLYLIHDGPLELQAELESAVYGLLGALQKEAGYEVDMRLRPEGSKGLQIISIHEYQRYYEERASFWELQSLHRCRVVVGDERLQAQWRELAGKKAGGVELTKVELDAMLNLRAKSEPISKMRRDPLFDIKRSKGGIMDIEYAVQALLIYSYGKNIDSRIGDTNQALAQLSVLETWWSEYCQAMLRLYGKLRTLQLHIRLQFPGTGNTIPNGSEEREKLARVLEYNSWHELSGELGNLQRDVRRNMDQVFSELKERI